MASLIEMPELLMERILKNLDFREVQTLRKVCHNLRDFIDDHKPDAKIDSIYYHVCDGYIRIYYLVGGTTYDVTYRNNGSNCEVQCGDKTKILNESNYVDTFLKDFPIILSFQASALHMFSVEARSRRSRENHVYNETLRLLTSILKSRKPLLQTKNMRVNVLYQHQMPSILPYLDSNGLKTVEVLDPMCHDGLLTLNLGKVVKLNHWKTAKTVNVGLIRFPRMLKNFEHFSCVHMLADKMRVEDMEFVKKTFLDSTTMNYLRLSFQEHQKMAQFLGTLGPPAVGVGYRGNVWYFRMNNSSDVLKIEWQIPEIIFSRVKTEDIEGIEIQG